MHLMHLACVCLSATWFCAVTLFFSLLFLLKTKLIRQERLYQKVQLETEKSKKELRNAEIFY